MKVRELLELLQRLPDDMTVNVSDGDEYGPHDVNAIYTESRGTVVISSDNAPRHGDAYGDDVDSVLYNRHAV